jgi:glycosyltransferase involved in cell wall biosynthesis
LLHNKTFSLSIIIPTVRISKYLDQAIESCFKIKRNIDLEIIVSVNNQSLDGYENSRYFNHSDVQWMCIETDTQPMEKSWNFAIDFASKDWIFLLSDDDVIGSGFLSDIDFDKLTEISLYLTRSQIIDENNIIKGSCFSPSKYFYHRCEILELFFKHKIQDHLSLMVFHKKLYKKIKGFSYAGYPSGLYIDTIFHGKAFANCDQVFIAKEIVFYRRESSTQQSSKFYSDSKVNDYFDVISNSFVQDHNFDEQVKKRFKTVKSFREYLMKFRFFVEWRKLHNPIYQKNFKQKSRFFINYFKNWQLPLSFKLLSVLFIFIYTIKIYLIRFKFI